MSVNGVTGYSADYSNYDSTAKSAKSEEQAKNSQKNSSGVTYSSKMTDSERAEVVAKLKSDSQRQIDSFGKDFILCILCCTGSWNIKSFIQTGTLRERVP